MHQVSEYITIVCHLGALHDKMQHKLLPKSEFHNFFKVLRACFQLNDLFEYKLSEFLPSRVLIVQCPSCIFNNCRYLCLPSWYFQKNSATV